MYSLQCGVLYLRIAAHGERKSLFKLLKALHYTKQVFPSGNVQLLKDAQIIWVSLFNF
jgi:hypothetical protein